MAIIKDCFIDFFFDKGTTFRSFLPHTLGKGDKNGDMFGVRCYNTGYEPVLLGQASVRGYFIRPDQNTVIINGVADGNKAYVTLPESCYVMDGPFSLAIVIDKWSERSTVRIVDGIIANTIPGQIVDPGGVVPSVAEVEALIAQAEADIATLASKSVTAVLISGNNYKIVVANRT